MGTTLDTDALIFLEHELNDEIECDEDGCTNKAEWSLTKMCCMESFLICSACRKNVLLFMAKLQMQSGGMKCYDCGKSPLNPEEIVFNRI